MPWTRLDDPGQFQRHDGFDGTILGDPNSRYHFEFTQCLRHSVAPAPTVEDLVVLYIPEQDEWQALCGRMVAAGFKQVVSFNPYWEVRGRTYEDPDGYRTVLECSEWTNEAAV